MRSRSSSTSDVAAFGRQAIATGAMCGAFVTITLLSFAAALLDRLRGATPPDDPVEYGGLGTSNSPGR